MRRSDFFRAIDLKLHSSDNMRLVNAFVDSIGREIVLPVFHCFDVGCGYGLATEHMIKFARNLTVFDIDRQALDFISRKFPNVNVSADGIIPDDVDFIYFFMSLHHIKKFHSLVTDCLHRLKQNAGKGVAICEMIPNPTHKFHRYEPSVYDGLTPNDFAFLKAIPDLNIVYRDLPSLTHQGVEYQCYSLIAQLSQVNTLRKDRKLGVFDVSPEHKI